MLEKNEIRLEHTQPLGLAGEVGTFFGLPTGEVVTIAFERWAGRNRPTNSEQVAFDELRPDLARAASLAARLRLSEAVSTVEAIGRLGLAAAVVDASGKVLAVNDIFGRLGSVVIPTAFGRLALAERNGNALLQSAIASDIEAARVLSIAVKASGDQPASVFQVIPIRRSARDIFGRADKLIVVSVFGGKQLPANTLLMSLFDLSPAEARLGQAIAAGATLNTFAARSGISIHTARSQLASVFAKTGTRRQAEFAALLNGIHLPVEDRY